MKLPIVLRCLTVLMVLNACSLVNYQPTRTLDKIETHHGYRLQNSINHIADKDNTLVVMMFSGGGTRAAAFSYGVLEALQKHPFVLNKQKTHLVEQADVVYGVSGGSVLAAYFSLNGVQTIPNFEKHFLKQNFQRQVLKQAFSFANVPRLTSPEFGRGDLLQEEFENTLFGKTTFADLSKHRKGPFAVISASDMTLGKRVDFIQEFFDPMCIDLGDVRLARAVAASSAVPLVFAPLTFNNRGGHCDYVLPPRFQQTDAVPSGLQQQTRQELITQVKNYQNSQKRPYIHLLDGGLTDNLGMRSLLDNSELYTDAVLRQKLKERQIKRIIVIHANAQNQPIKSTDRYAAVPAFRDVLDAVINIPIDQNSQESLRRFRALVDHWNHTFNHVSVYFVSLNLTDLPESDLREQVLNIPTSFYLPKQDINRLKLAAARLLQQSSEFKRLLKDLNTQEEHTKPNKPHL